MIPALSQSAALSGLCYASVMSMVPNLLHRAKLAIGVKKLGKRTRLNIGYLA